MSGVAALTLIVIYAATHGWPGAYVGVGIAFLVLDALVALADSGRAS